VSTESINAAAYREQTAFPVPGGTITIDRVADNRAVANLTTRLKPYLGDGAAAVADVVVDPARARKDLGDGKFVHLDTPSGRQLRCLRCEGWTAVVSGDGANGRSRLDQQRTGEVDPWPLPGTVKGLPVLAYETTDLERMAKAVEDSAAQILTRDIVTRVRANPRGIWNPPLAVAAVAKQKGQPLEVFVHTIEGSTRVSAAHHVVGTDHGAPVRNAANTRDLIRSERAKVASALVATPDSKPAQDAAKLLKCAMLIVVAVVDEHGNPCKDPFNEVAAELVESVHEEPRAWDALAQGNAVGERLVARLHEEGQLDADALADILQRDDFHTSTTTPSEIATHIVRAATRPDAEPILREVILSDPEARYLTGRRKALALAPLVLRAHRGVAGLRESAVAALSRDFIPSEPSELCEPSWAPSGRTIDKLEAACARHVKRKPGTWNDDLRELCARSVGSLCSLGLVLSDQGQAVDEIKELRGKVSEVMSGLCMTLGGVRLMADAVRRADGATDLFPLQRKPDGSPITVVDRDGNEIGVRYNPLNRETNMLVRALALNGGVIPKNGGKKRARRSRSPQERFVDAQEEFVQLTGALIKTRDQLLEILGTDGRPLIDATRLDAVKFGAVQGRLMQAVSFVLKYRAEDVPDPHSDEPLDEEDEAHEEQEEMDLSEF
jgi:hypothetical protein